MVNFNNVDFDLTKPKFDDENNLELNPEKIDISGAMLKKKSVQSVSKDLASVNKDSQIDSITKDEEFLKNNWIKLSVEQKHEIFKNKILSNMSNLENATDEEKEDFIKKYIEYHAMMANKPVLTRKDKWESEWNEFDEVTKQGYINDYLSSYHKALEKDLSEKEIRKSLHDEKFAAFQQQVSEIEEKINSGQKITQDEADMYIKNIQHERAKTAVNEAEQKYSDVKDFEDLFNEKYSDKINELNSKNINQNSREYKHELAMLQSEYFVELYDSLPEDEKDYALATLNLSNPENKRRFFAISRNINDEKKREEIAGKLGLSVSQDERNSLYSELGVMVKDGTATKTDVENMAYFDKGRLENGLSADSNLGELGEYGNAYQEVLLNFGSENVQGYAASKTHELTTEEQQIQARELISTKDNAEGLVTADITGASNAGKKEQVDEAQAYYNGKNGNENTRQGVIDATKNIKEEWQDEYDKKNVECIENLEDEEQAKRLYNHRTDEMQNFATSVQANAYERTMSSKYDEVKEYAASNIYKLDESVRDYAVKITKALGNEKITNAIQTKAPDNASDSSKTSKSKSSDTAQNSKSNDIQGNNSKTTTQTPEQQYRQAVQQYSQTYAKSVIENHEINKNQTEPEELKGLSKQQKLQRVAEYFLKSTPVEQYRMLSKLTDDQRKMVIAHLCKANSPLLKDLISQGLGKDVLSVVGKSAEVSQLAVGIMLRKGGSDAKLAADYVMSTQANIHYSDDTMELALQVTGQNKEKTVSKHETEEYTSNPNGFVKNTLYPPKSAIYRGIKEFFYKA